MRKVIRAMFIPRRAPIPNLRDLWAHTRGARKLVILVAILAGIQITLDTTVGLFVRDFLDNLSLKGGQAFSISQVVETVVFYLVLSYVLNPGIDAWQSLTLARLNEHVRQSVTLSVHNAIQERRLGSLNVARMETQIGTQPNSIHHGFEFGIKPLIQNASTVAGAVILMVSALYGAIGLIALAFALLFWLLLHNSIGQWHYKQVAVALSAASTCERLLRHMVRPRWLFYYWRHHDTPARRQLEKEVKQRSQTNIDQEMRGEIYKFCLQAGIGAVLVGAVFLAVLRGGIQGASFIGTGIFLLVIQSDKLLAALKAIGAAGKECQHIAFGFSRIYEGIWKGIEILPSLNQDDEGKLQEPLRVVGNQLEVIDVHTGKVVIEDLKFELLHGQVILVSGPPNTGKTPLLDAMTGVVRPRGMILVNGIPVTRIPIYQLIAFPKKVFNNDLTLLETLGGPGPQKVVSRGKKRGQDMQALLAYEQARSELIALVDALAREMGIEDAIHNLPRGYDTPMLSVGRLLSQDHLWAVLFLRNLVTTGQLPRLQVLDQALDKLHDQVLLQRLIAMLNRLAKDHDMLVIISTELGIDRFTDSGLQVDQVIDLEKFRPVE